MQGIGSGHFIPVDHVRVRVVQNSSQYREEQARLARKGEAMKKAEAKRRRKAEKRQRDAAKAAIVIAPAKPYVRRLEL